MKTSRLITVVGFALGARMQTVPVGSIVSTASSTFDCDAAWGSLEANLPTPPPSLSDAWNAAHTSNGQFFYFTTLAEICSFESANLDGGATDDTRAYSTFNLQYYSWYSASSGPWKSLVTQCPSTAVYGPVDHQTSELDGVLTAYSSFAIAGCGQTQTATATATMTEEATMPNTSIPTTTPVTVNSGRRKKSTAVGIIIAQALGVQMVLAM